MRAGTSRSAAHDDVVRDSARGLAPLELLARTAERIRTVLPYDGAGWLLVDPASGLNTAGVPINVSGGLHLQLIECEITEPDVNTFSALARARSPVARLSTTTEGELTRSTRHRRLYAPNGYGDELRAVFRLGDAVWGQVCLSRYEDQAPFSRAEADLIRQVGRHLAAGIRAGHLLDRVRDGTTAPSGVPAPGVVIVDDAGHATSITDEARALLDPVPVPGLQVPMAVHEVAQRARVLADSAVGPPATARLRAGPDRWLVLHGSRLGSDQTAVVVASARPAEIAPIIARAYGLTPREREITSLWCRGLDVATIATTLVISPHTVHDHIKAVYAKVAVGSRAELLATLFDEQTKL